MFRLSNPSDSSLESGADRPISSQLVGYASDLNASSPNYGQFFSVFDASAGGVDQLWVSGDELLAVNASNATTTRGNGSAS